jgi:hypothetical protein
MIRLLGRGDEAGPPRAAADAGFVPRLETLEARVALSTWSVGKKVKIDFAVANPDVPAQVSTLPPPAVGVAPPPADADAAAGLVRVPGRAGFDRGGGHGFDPAKTDKDKFEPYYAGGSANGSVDVLGVWVGTGVETPAATGKATPILF